MNLECQGPELMSYTHVPEVWEQQGAELADLGLGWLCLRWLWPSTGYCLQERVSLTFINWGILPSSAAAWQCGISCG